MRRQRQRLPGVAKRHYASPKTLFVVVHRQNSGKINNLALVLQDLASRALLMPFDTANHIFDTYGTMMQI